MASLEEELGIGPATPIGRGNAPLDPSAQGDAELIMELLGMLIPGAGPAAKGIGSLRKLSKTRKGIARERDAGKSFGDVPQPPDVGITGGSRGTTFERSPATPSETNLRFLRAILNKPNIGRGGSTNF